MSKLLEEYKSNHYKEVCPLGKNGNVVLAVNEQTGQKCVQKTISREFMPIYQNLKKIKQKNISEIYNVIPIDRNIVVIEEYIDGRTLRDIIDSNAPLTSEQIISIAIQLCDAAEAIHQRSIIHRDINPNNIIITSDFRAVLIDFNIARIPNSSAQNDTTILGTKGYVAPEQFGFMQTGPTADIYSIGKVLEELASHNETLMKSDSLDVFIIKTATNFTPSERYQTASKMKRALEFYSATRLHLFNQIYDFFRLR